MNNEMQMCGIDFVEFSSPAGTAGLEKLFWSFGFSKVAHHPTQNVSYFRQNDIHFFVNHDGTSFAGHFSRDHGPSLSSMGWRFKDPQKAYHLALAKGAKPAKGDYHYPQGENIPAIYGIGESLIYFVSPEISQGLYSALGFTPVAKPQLQPTKGFLAIDHLTNNVPNGTMKKWSDFYKDIFGFSEVRYFDIRGVQTGLTSYALRSPCGSFCIPINEAKEAKSQINEYLEEYKGAGVQHLAFLTEDILTSLNQLQGSGIETLDIDDEYYQEIFTKFPQVTEDQQKIRQHQVLIDGDSEGYLLQIFTKNLIGPIFIEIIQRKNHLSFGEGNFGALFRSIERDQMKRGYLNS
jgi:4-hydroxyphenylpyruvate dioxygenase